jgi:O-glycosyl hydrolase
MKFVVPACALAVLTFAVPACADYTATVDPTARHQNVEGWGTSLCWWANVVGGFPQKVQDDYLNKIFDVKQGLGMNVVRYNIGGGENPNIPNTMQVRARVPGFEPSLGVWDWSADANQRKILLESMSKGVNIEEAFSNSPPWWMTISGSVTGNDPGSKNNLKPEDFHAFADYLTTVVQHYHDAWGVTFQTLEPMNESATGWWKLGGSQEGYHIDPRNAAGDDQNSLVKDVADSLKQKHSATVESAPDENTVELTLTSVNSYDPQVQADIGQINTHTYENPADFAKRQELGALANKLGVRAWISEHGDGDGTGMTVARDILSGFNDLGCTAWVYWQAVDGGGWGMLNKDNNDTTHYNYTINEKYYITGQFSRFLRPGDRIIGSDDANSLVGYRAKDGTLTIVTQNNTDTPANVTYDLSHFSKFGGKVTAVQSSATEKWAKLPSPSMTGMKFTATDPPKSVTTYVVTEIF